MEIISGSEALPPLLTDRQWAYRVDSADHTDEASWAMISWGTRTMAAITMDDLANRVAEETRVSHSYYTGPLRVSIWEKRPDEYYRNAAPDGCSRYIYPGAGEESA